MKFLSNPKRWFGAALLTLPAGLTSGQDLKSSESLTANVERLLTTVVINYRGLALLEELSIGAQVTLMYGAGVHYSVYSHEYAAHWLAHDSLT